MGPLAPHEDTDGTQVMPAGAGEASGGRAEVLFCQFITHLHRDVLTRLQEQSIVCPFGAQLCWLLKFSDIIKHS